MPTLFGAADIATSLFVDMPEMWANSANKFFDGLASGTCIAIDYQGWQADLLVKSDRFHAFRRRMRLLPQRCLRKY